MLVSLSPFIFLLAQTTGSQPAAPAIDYTTLLIWAIVLIGMAMALFFVELFVPSGGIIGLIGAVCLVAGVVMLFRVDTTWGLLGAAVSLVAIPCIIVVGMKLWPDMPMARWLILRNDDSEAQPTEAASPDGAGPALASGSTGSAVTDLRPVGMCLIDGRRVECLASQGMIEAGDPVKVVAVDGMQIKVAKMHPRK